MRMAKAWACFRGTAGLEKREQAKCRPDAAQTCVWWVRLDTAKTNTEILTFSGRKELKDIRVPEELLSAVYFERLIRC